MRKAPFPPWPSFPSEWSRHLREILESGKVNYHTGKEGKAFEEEFAAYCGRRYGISLMNGTVALELALKAYGIGAGDEVIVTPRSFIASASCIVSAGATPIFADIDPVSQNITPETIKERLTERTKAIVAVHHAGWPCEMDPIMDVAEKRGLIVIEDCAQAHGASYNTHKAGALGHIAAFSFCQDKIFTTGGEGGMVLTDDHSTMKKIWALRDHGKDLEIMKNLPSSPAFKWVHTSFGSNYRMTEFQSALGRLGLKEMDKWVEMRRYNAAMLSKCLSQFPSIRITDPPKHIYHSYYKYYCFIRPDNLREGWSRDKIMEAISAEGIPCFSGSCPEIYREKAFEAIKTPPERLPVAKELGETSLMFLVHPTIGAKDMDDMQRAIEKVLSIATK
ncbi:MAG: DegT/DnrJ/EryC1/StrS aminotransferase family protein [Candidatus Dadabacteria bacterium]|nr:MAG: DegT/DnrJ/EryC1/StrS aminotransferase family protein [Candidatus Dadabacteria bacterium]